MDKSKIIILILAMIIVLLVVILINSKDKKKIDDKDILPQVTLDQNDNTLSMVEELNIAIEKCRKIYMMNEKENFEVYFGIYYMMKINKAGYATFEQICYTIGETEDSIIY